MARGAVNIPSDVSFTPDTSAYGDGDVLGGLLTFSIAANAGLITTVILVEDDNEGATLDLFLFDKKPSTIADNVAFAPTIADMQKLIRKVSLASASYFTENSLKVIQVDLNTHVPFWSQTIYGYLVLNGDTPTFGASKTVNVRLINAGEK